MKEEKYTNVVPCKWYSEVPSTLVRFKKLVKTKYYKCNIFRVTTDLLNSENVKVVFAQLCNKLQVCNFAMV